MVVLEGYFGATLDIERLQRDRVVDDLSEVKSKQRRDQNETQQLDTDDDLLENSGWLVSDERLLMVQVDVFLLFGGIICDSSSPCLQSSSSKDDDSQDERDDLESPQPTIDEDEEEMEEEEEEENWSLLSLQQHLFPKFSFSSLWQPKIPKMKLFSFQFNHFFVTHLPLLHSHLHSIGFMPDVLVQVGFFISTLIQFVWLIV